MTRPVAPRGGPRGPRQAPAPRSSAGARGPGVAHRPRRATALGYGAREIPEPSVAEAAVVADPSGETQRRARDRGWRRTRAAVPATRRASDRWSELRARRAQSRATRAAERDARREQAAPGPAPAGELSGLRLLLDQLDALMRDPTLANALRRFTDKVKAGLRLPRLRWPDWLRLVRLPRWLALPLLALLLGLGSIALLTSGDDRESPGPSGAEIALPGVGMPALAAAADDPPAARIALVVDDTYSPAELRRELQTLGSWLDANHAPGTRVTLIDAASGRASAAVRAADLGGAMPIGPASSTSAAVSDAFRGAGGRRLLVGVGSPAPRSSATTLTVATRPGAPSATQVPLRRGQRSRVAIDDRRPGALAASVARALIGISNQRER